MTGRALALVATLTCGAVAALATPAAANFVAVTTDPEGDASDPHPGRDINAMAMEYDPETGALKGAIRFRGAPGDDGISFMTLALGTRTPAGCNGYPATVLASTTDEYDGTWHRFDAPGAGAAGRGFADKYGFDTAVQTFDVEERELRDRDYDCAVATITEPGNAANVYDTTTGVDMIGQPELALRVPSRTTKLEPGRSKRIAIRVTNPGDGPATGVRLRFGREKGLKRTPGARRLGTLAPGATRTVKVKVRLSRRASTFTDLTVSARANEKGLLARGEVPLRLMLPARRGGGGKPGFTPRTCVRWSPDLSGESGGSLILVPC